MNNQKKNSSQGKIIACKIKFKSEVIKYHDFVTMPCSEGFHA